MFKTFISPLVFATLAAATLSLVSDRRGFEELAVRAAIAEEARATDTKCPLSPQYTDTADVRLLSICLRYGLDAYDAARRYPETSPKVFAVYGEDETFQKVLNRLGHEVIPVVAYFVEHGSREFQLRQAAGEAMQQVWEGKRPKWQPSNITREQIGLIAIYHLERRGHEMLAEFEIVDGAAIRKPMRRFFFAAKDLLVGGVEDIETILVRGERLPTWKEVGFAALDVTIIAGGVGAITKAARLGIGTAEAVEKGAVRLAAEGAVEKNSVRFAAEGAAGNNAILVAAEGAYEALSAIGKAGVVVAPVAFAYVVITRPQLVASAGGWIAEQLGGNRIAGIFAVYLIGIFLVLQFLRPLLWLGRIVGKPIFRFARYAVAKRQRQNARGLTHCATPTQSS
ncbi:MAG TPA: hypothetical protein VKC66_36105 [Xanthobacteraceae bacterium]|nr:hypothetical protein [Xanthobacteraceae bacterium]